MRADRIEAVLASHKVQGRVWGGTVSPSCERFQLMISATTKVQKVQALADEIALTLRVPAVRVFREGGAIVVEVPRDTTETLLLSSMAAMLPKPMPPLTAVLGRDTTGQALLLDLSSPNIVHCLVAGTTGSGKTTLINTMIASLSEHNSPDAVRFLLIDVKGGRALGSSADLPHTIGGVFVAATDAALQLESAVATMEKRDLEGRSTPAIVIVIDELADLISQHPETTASITRLAQRGREAGMHLIAGTQRPASAVLGGIMKANFPARLVGRVLSPEDSKVATGIAGQNAEALQGRGDFLLVGPAQTIRFQVAKSSTGVNHE